MSLSVKAIHAYEQLEMINKESDETKKLQLLKQFGGKSPLNFILSMNFNDNIRLALPNGMPPIDPKYMDMHTHPDFMGLLSGSIHKLKYCLPNNSLTPRKREELFIDVLINCPLKDAEIVCSAKDKALLELYPTITAELVKTVFPEYVHNEVVKE